MEKQLFAMIQERRKRGRRVSALYLTVRAKELFRKLYVNCKNVFLASHGWRQRFCARYNLVTRSKTNVKQHSAIDRLVTVRQWHRAYKAFLMKKMDGHQWDPVWGRYRQDRRINADQVFYLLL